MSEQAIPLVQIGWVLAVDSEKPALQEFVSAVGEQVIRQLREQFPQFEWQLNRSQRKRFTERGQLDPLPLLELGVQEKLRNGWDYVFVLVPNELQARKRIRTIGVPSSALESMVLSLAPFMGLENSAEKAAQLALHLFGHVQGLNHEDATPMQPPEIPHEMAEGTLFSAEQITFISDRLQDVADSRTEELAHHHSRIGFYLHALRADPISILQDIWQYRPWRLPLRMGRLTAATTVTIIILLMAAEAWEVGTNFDPILLIIGTICAIFVATTFVFIGQNLGEVSRGMGMREQLVRTRVLVYATLFLGMTALWTVLFVVSFLAGLTLPRDVLIGWSQNSGLGMIEIARQAAFMALLGVIAGALGGNLEDEDELKAELFFDEES